MEFKFPNFKLYTQQLQKINFARQELKKPPLWLDYEILYDLNAYGDNYKQFKNIQDKTIILNVKVEQDLREIQQIMDIQYTHIGLAFSNGKYIIMLSAKSFAIDQIQIVKQNIEVTVIRLNQEIHLWGAEIIKDDLKEQVIGPDSIQIKSKSELEYVLKISKKSIGAKLYSTQHKQRYGVKTFYIHVPSQCKLIFLIPILEVSSFFDQLVMKQNAQVRVSNYKKMDAISSRFSKINIDDKRYGLPQIKLNSNQCGSLFGEPQLILPRSKSISRKSVFKSQTNRFINPPSQSCQEQSKQQTKINENMQIFKQSLKKKQISPLVMSSSSKKLSLLSKSKFKCISIQNESSHSSTVSDILPQSLSKQQLQIKACKSEQQISETFLSFLENEQNFSIIDKLNQSQKMFENSNSSTKKERIGILKITMMKKLQNKITDDNDFSKNNVTFEFIGQINNSNDWLILMQEFQQMNRFWRVIIRKKQQQSYLFLQQIKGVQNTFSMKYSSMSVCFKIEAEEKQEQKRIFYSFPNGQKSSIGMKINLPNTEKLKIKIQIYMKPFYVHSACLHLLTQSCINLSPKSQLKYSFANILIKEAKYQQYISQLFPNLQQNIQDTNQFIQNWYLNMSQCDLFWLLMNNSFQSFQQQDLLFLAIKYYQSHTNISNSFIAFYAIRYNCIQISTLQTISKLSTSPPILKQILQKQIDYFKQQKQRYPYQLRFHSTLAVDQIQELFIDQSVKIRQSKFKTD